MVLDFSKFQIDFSFVAPNASCIDARGTLLLDSFLPLRSVTIATPQKDNYKSINRTAVLTTIPGSGTWVGNKTSGTSISLKRTAENSLKYAVSMQLRSGLDGTIDMLLLNPKTGFPMFGFENKNIKPAKTVNLPFKLTVDGVSIDIVLPLQYTATANVIGKAVLS
jgi:hypothetical protein